MSEAQQYFDSILSNNEKILWADSPKFFPFLFAIWPQFLTGVGLMCFVLYGAFVQGMGHEKRLIDIDNIQSYDFHILLFFFLSFSMSIGALIWRALTYSNTYYALTDKRVILRGGFLGVDYKSVDHDKISEMLFDVNVLEKIYNCGTIKAFSGRVNSKGNREYDSIVGISNPYDVYKLFKGVNLDIKADISYPNALRPAENPGYKTDYKP